jgi:alkaline phosphatase
MFLLRPSLWIAILLLLVGCHRPPTPIEVLPPLLAPPEHPRNVILMIGDGMGLTQVSALLYQQNNQMALEAFPVVGFHKNPAVDNLITDSAAGATAFSCGLRTYEYAIGVDQDTLPCPTLLEQAKERGLATGMIATSSIVHATPAAFLAHQPMRIFYEAIAADYLKTEIDLLIGGGKRYFDRREDERNLLQLWKDRGYYIDDYFNNELFVYSKLNPKSNFVFFTADKDPVGAIQGRRYLPYAVRLGTDFLDNRPGDGFILMVEGSQIDWKGHGNEATELLLELQDFDKAIQEALDFAEKDGETLVIVTADHETGGLGINPGSKMKKLNLSFTTNGHTGSLVPVFAYGPGSERFSGIYENYEINHKIKAALGWKNDKSAAGY